MCDVDGVPFPKPRRLRLWEEGRPHPVPFPFRPLKGAEQKRDGGRATLRRRKRLGLGKGT
jgi:hypothetical protein